MTTLGSRFDRAGLPQIARVAQAEGGMLALGRAAVHTSIMLTRPFGVNSLPQMKRVVLVQLQILNAIVRSILVDMVHDLLGPKQASKVFLHYQSMLKNISSAISSMRVIRHVHIDIPLRALDPAFALSASPTSESLGSVYPHPDQCLTSAGPVASKNLAATSQRQSVVDVQFKKFFGVNSRHKTLLCCCNYTMTYPAEGGQI